MDKQAADKMIKQYYKKLYGFALSKAYTMDEAEELASRIVLEVYVALLKVDDIYNWDGYIYRIAWNVYARYVKEIKYNHNPSIHDMEIPSEVDFTKEIEKSEEYRILRREVSWLSKIQRKIIYMHYIRLLKYEVETKYRLCRLL